MREQLTRLVRQAVVKGDLTIVDRLPADKDWSDIWRAISCTLHYVHRSRLVLFKDYLDWATLCRSCYLDGGIVKAVADRVDWTTLARFRTTSFELIWENRGQIRWPELRGRWSRSCPTRPEFLLYYDESVH